ncbi:hypothetical protein Ctob_003696 [Chrysochromulina tobinii]|uniref:Uncharacterized protein n=1 Tax=Chrysochromulina tobinii TaxID=1460289 RepID=A0A0M0J7G0_9EUKA|nr:hypothetical protein Ctob_003696 [Chrysochromulina tobinii]|eukprot:KOO22292.1 hypothetical protein Ctob_003696 [Chrysochromulina sp. CCMP291]
MMDLRGHAPSDRAREQVDDEVQQLRKVAGGLEEDGDDVKDARDELEAVGARDQLVVARVGADLLGVHYVDAGERDRKHRATEALEAQAEARALAALARIDAAALAEVALAARVIVQTVVILVEHRLARPAGGAPKGYADHGDDAAARLCAARVLESNAVAVW